ncbi:MAG: nitrous oxide-stimulated promoter family protein [Thermoplasmata archaeon]|nr:nitrous oxide-stimulated promoter family protein [Thermoplasmata archaeon]
MAIKNSGISREKATVRAMIEIYCHGHHDTSKKLCEDCSELLNYSFLRLDKCPFQETKPTCANCTIHCYKPAMREKIRAVMRYSGPRMLVKHPILTLRHFLAKFKTKSGKTKRK